MSLEEIQRRFFNTDEEDEVIEDALLEEIEDMLDEFSPDEIQEELKDLENSFQEMAENVLEQIR